MSSINYNFLCMLIFDFFCNFGSSDMGEVAEWLKAHAWKACICNTYQGFESLSLRS